MIGNHFEVVCHQLPHASKIMHFLKLYLRLYEPCNHSKNASSSCLWCQLFVVAAPGWQEMYMSMLHHLAFWPSWSLTQELMLVTWVFFLHRSTEIRRKLWEFVEKLWWFTIENLALIFENGRMEPDDTFIIWYKCNTGLKECGFARITARTVRITSCPIWSDRCIPVTQKNPH